MNREFKIEKELLRIAENRNKIIEDFIRTYIAVNIPAEEMTPSTFDRLELRMEWAPGGARYWIAMSDKPKNKSISDEDK